MDPVKDTLSISLCAVKEPPAVGPYPGTIFITPGGNPASLIRLAMYKAERGVCSAGLITTVLPAAIAGPSLLLISKIGKFH